MGSVAVTKLQDQFEGANRLLESLRALGRDARTGFVHFRPDSHGWEISLGSRSSSGEGLRATPETLRALCRMVEKSESADDRRIRALALGALSQMDGWRGFVQSDEYSPPRALKR